MFDVIVVGGGPAGVSAAIYLKRFRNNVAIIMKDYGTLGKTEHIENYYGFVEPISGKELFENGIKQAKRLDIPVFQEEVVGIESFDDFTVKTNKNEYRSKVVLLATGANRSSLRVKGFNEFVGKGISFCAVCDGFLYRGKRIGLVGNGDFMLEELDVLQNFSDDITVFTHSLPLETHLDGVRIVSDKIKEIKGEETLKSIVTDEGTFDIDVLFIAMGTPSAADFAVRMGAFTDRNDIVVDDQLMTNIPGLFAAGDCIGGGWLQIVKAADDGSKAAFSINKYLRKRS